jgi:hypothetical protein
MIIQVDNSSVMVWDLLGKNPAVYQDLQVVLVKSIHTHIIFPQILEKIHCRERRTI